MLKNVVYYDIEQQNVFRAMYMCFGFVLFFQNPNMLRPYHESTVCWFRVFKMSDITEWLFSGTWSQ